MRMGVVLVGMTAFLSCAQTERPTLVETEPSEPVREEFRIPTGAYDDLDGSLAAWKQTVLDRVEPADRARLAELRAHIQSEIAWLTARDRELAEQPAGVAIETRIDLAHRLAFEKARLELVEARLAQ